MIVDKKVIGVCVSRIHSICVNEFLSELHQLTKKLGVKLIVFNSPVDFYNKDANDMGAKTVYSIINYDLVDALIIQAENFHDDKVYLDIIDKAKAHDTPVLLLKREGGGCPCILNDYADGYKALMRHVITEHGARDTFFIAGRKEEDEQSVKRIECYREVLEECGLEFSKDLVEYGEYWNIPTYQALERILQKRGGRPPKAIFCANDYMAIAVCEDLKRRGFKVPEDVYVTGFDGIREAEYMVPQLSTCKEDFSSLARSALDIVIKLMEGRQVPDVTYNQFAPVFAESCGCPYYGAEPRVEAQRQYSLVHESLSHDEFVFGWLSEALEAKDMAAFKALLPSLILSFGQIALNEDFMEQVMQQNTAGRSHVFTDTLEIYCSKYASWTPKEKTFLLSDMIPEPEHWAAESEQDDTVYVLSAINSGEEVYGYYAVSSSGILTDSHNINRSLAAINIGFDSIVRYYRQRITLLGLKNAALTDHLTGLPNLKGTTAWFEELSLVPANHDKCLTISIYGIPKYKYIYENYGIKEIEESVKTVAELLRRSNKDNAFIGRVSDDEFLVINSFDDPSEISPEINRATDTFFNHLGDYNAENGKEYYLEVNAGCTDLFPGWEGTLASFSRLAGNAMYLNRLSADIAPAVKHSSLPSEVYKSFELLIENNLFDYHFQPIVDVKTADIIAYEALMRPHRSVNMSPEQVIEAARQYDRLGDVEHATMFNIMRIYKNKRAQFRGRRVFINSIPGHFLHGKAYDDFLDEFSAELGGIVVEITEGSSVSDKELSKLKTLRNGGIPIAIDDYGTGHSNIVNLLRYSPQIIKIDRFLITAIQSDTNKQLFFRSTVEFAHMNNMKVLAEGVETSDELECVINLGADLIQGFFTGRPAPEPAAGLAEDIRALILKGKYNAAK